MALQKELNPIGFSTFRGNSILLEIDFASTFMAHNAKVITVIVIVFLMMMILISDITD
jgi:hypothetical protein